MQERTHLEGQIKALTEIQTELDDSLELAEMAEEEGDEGAIDDIQQSLRTLRERAGRAELEALLSGEADGNDAYLEIQIGRASCRERV